MSFKLKKVDVPKVKLEGPSRHKPKEPRTWKEAADALKELKKSKSSSPLLDRLNELERIMKEKK